jgi:hypothetical protein
MRNGTTSGFEPIVVEEQIRATKNREWQICHSRFSSGFRLEVPA